MSPKLGVAQKLGHKSKYAVCMGHKRRYTMEEIATVPSFPFSERLRIHKLK